MPRETKVDVVFSRAEAALAEVLRQVLEDGGDDNYAVAEIVHERA